MGLSSGCTPGIDGLSNEFYKHFWSTIGTDLFEVLQECIQTGSLPKSCQRAILTLLPKKGDLTSLKNWRPVAILCTEYKLLSKCLANRLNKMLFKVIHKGQSYCIKKDVFLIIYIWYMMSLIMLQRITSIYDYYLLIKKKLLIEWIISIFLKF